MTQIAITPHEVAPRIKPSNYPEPFKSQMTGRVKRALGDHFGLKNFGVNHTTLPPSAVSALLHTHSRQDEFVMVLTGELTLQTFTDGGGLQEQTLTTGMCMGFAANSGVAHRLLNKGTFEATYLEVGDRTMGDSGTYPLDDLIANYVNGSWHFTHKDGSAY